MTELNSLAPIVIRASAGSGKTFQLTNRFLRLLLLGESPDRILATTFTRKAAGEIAERIFTRLSNATLDPRKARQLGHELGLPKLTEHDAGAALRKLVLHEHRLNISTLDSFFHGIAAAFGLEIGLQPGWSVADTFGIERLLEDGVKRFCSDAESDRLSLLLQLMRGGKSGRRVTDDLKALIGALLDLYRTTDRSAWEWLDGRIPQPAQPLAELIEMIVLCPPPLTKEGTPRKSWAAALTKLAAGARERDWTALFENGLVKKILEGATSFDRVTIAPTLSAAVAGLVEHAAAELLPILAEQNRATYTLIGELDTIIEELKRGARVLDFSDVKYRLSRSATLGALDEVYYRLDTRIAHILFDEFQDTSRAEWSIVEPMAAEILSKASGDHSFLCVGDTKQAIYGWRGGVAEIFNQLKRRWNFIAEVPLVETRRCAVAVVEAVNVVFSAITSNPALSRYADAAAAWGARFARHQTTQSDRAGYAALEAIDGDSAEETRSHIELRAIDIVRDLLQKPGEFSIGILTRGNAAVGRLMFALQEAGIRASDESKSSLLDSPAVEALRALLTVADHPANTMARFHLATSPLGGALHYTDWQSDVATEALGRRVRETVAARGFGATIRAFADLLMPACSARDRLRLSQCVEQSHLFRATEPTRLSEFNRWLEHVELEGGKSERVRVMTVHQSKGLEFDVVLLIDLDGAMIKRGSFDAVPILTASDDPTEPPTRVSRRPRAEIIALNNELRGMVEFGEAEAVKDNLSVLYVAMTRARYALYMLVGTNDRETSLGKVLKNVLGGGDAPGLRYSTGSAEWFERYEPEKGEVAEPRKPRSGSVTLAPSPTRRRRGLLRETPSGREGGNEVAVKEILRITGGGAADYGRLIHRLFQQIEWVDGLPSEAELLTLLERDFVGVEKPGDTVREFLGLLGAKAVTAELSRTRYAIWGADSLEVLREQSFAVREGDAVMTGTFDRLVIGRRNGVVVAAHIIDYKTDRVRDEVGMTTRVRYYTPQIEAYIDAAVQFTRLPREAIEATLLFVTPGMTHYFSPSTTRDRQRKE